MKEKPHGRDLRKGRTSLSGQVYLITAVASERRPLIAGTMAGRIIVQRMMHSDRIGDTQSLAFVVMPDHFHWLLVLSGDQSLSSVIGAVKRHSSRQINRLDGCPGRQVWQRSFHDHALRHDEAVAHVARYIIANPLRAGLVKHIGDYSLWDAVWL